MQVEQAIAFVVEQEPAGVEIRINFGVFAGRDATTAELEELGKLLVPEAGEVSVTGEERHELAEGVEVVVRTTEPTKLLHDLTAEAIAAGGELEGLTVRRPTLEDVYLSLTGEDEA